MRPSKDPIVVATRKSRLAKAQAQAVGKALHRLNPRVSMRLAPVQSEGDRQTDRPLSGEGGKGLFTASVEQALLNGEANVAVHSMKDLPTAPTPGLVIAAIPKRLDPRDVLIAPEAESIDQLPRDAVVGTSSARRAAQLRRYREDLRISLMRGNVETRLRKVLEAGGCDATVLAAAGLRRAGLGSHIKQPIDPQIMLPAAGQGALAIQCRVEDHVMIRRCLPLNHAHTSTTVNAERAVVQTLEADCHSPLAVMAEEPGGDRLRVRARVLAPDGSRTAQADRTGEARTMRKLCDEVVRELREQGADSILADAPDQTMWTEQGEDCRQMAS